MNQSDAAIAATCIEQLAWKYAITIKSKIKIVFNICKSNEFDFLIDFYHSCVSFSCSRVMHVDLVGDIQ